MKSLDSIINVFGENQKIFVALELTKMHEAHYSGTVTQVFDDLQKAHEDKRIKGEVTIVLAPALKNEAQEMETDLKRQGFDLSKDAHLTVNVLKVAQTLDQ